MTFSEMSIAGAIMIIVIAIVRALTVNRLPKRTFVILWEIVLLRLLVPFSIPSVTSVYNFFDKPAESETAQVETVEYDYPEAAYVPDDFYGNMEHDTPVYTPPEEDSYVPEYEPVDRKKPVPVLKIVWLSGASVFVLLFISLYAVALSRFRFAEMVGEGLPVEILGSQGIKRKLKICVSSRVKAPLTYGIIRPVILLPKGLDTTDRELMTYIITHECTHIKKFDMCRKIIAAAAVCLHWFNPAVWAMYLLFNRDIELACDEAVVKATGLECRGVYANVLIGMETSRGFASLYSNFSKNAVEERITAIMKTKKLTKITAAVACAMVLAVAGVFVTSAVKKADIEEPPATADNALSADKTVYYGKAKSVIKSVLDEEGCLWPIAFAFADLNLDGTDELFLYTSSGPVGRPQEGYIRVYDISGEPVLLGKIKGNVRDYFGTAAPDEPCFGKLYSGANGSMHFIVDTYYENESWNSFRAYYDITYGEKFGAEIPLYGRVEQQYNGGAHLFAYELYSGCGSDLSAGYDYEKNHGFVTDNAEYLGRCDMFNDEISGYAEKYVYGGLNYIGDVGGVYRKTVVAADGYDVTGYGKAQSFEEYWQSVDNSQNIAGADDRREKAEALRSSIDKLGEKLDGEGYTLSSAVTYGVIDFNNDGTDEFFAVFSQGNQGYNEMTFYSVDNDGSVTELFSTSGFCRDGNTYFMYDDASPRLLIFSGFTHSYFLKKEKTEAVSGDCKVSKLFASEWYAASPYDEFEQTDTYISGEKVSADEYNKERDIFMGNKYRDIVYIYDGELYLGENKLNAGEDVYYTYLLEKESSAVRGSGSAANPALSREYEFDLNKYLERYDKRGFYSLRDDLNFLTDEQYETYLKALIFADEFEYFNIPYTGDKPYHWLDENGEVCDSYYNEKTNAYSKYTYVSTYQSFYGYLRSVYTKEAADRIISHRFFKVAGDELYFFFGEKGGPIDVQSGRYELISADDSEVTFKYIVDHTHDGDTWVTSFDLKLVNTGSGWRSEYFDYLRGTSRENTVGTVTVAGQEFSVDAASVTVKATNAGTDVSVFAFFKNLRRLEILSAEEGYSYAVGFELLGNMDTLEELYVKGVHISSNFGNRQYFKNLKKLYLDSTPISDISFIKDSTQLEEIYICNTNISDITPLSSLKRLKKVTITETEISDLSPLEGLDDLEYIFISGSTNIDNSQIEKLKKKLPKCEITANVGETIVMRHPDKILIEGVEHDAGKKTICLLYPDNDDLKNLAYFKNLKRVEFAKPVGNVDLSLLNGLPELEELVFAEADMRASGVRSESLKKLDIWKCDIDDVSFVQKNFPALEVLNIANNSAEMRGADTLAELKFLRELELRGVNIRDIGFVGKMTGLKKLWVDSNDISDLSPIAKLTGLESVNISYIACAHPEKYLKNPRKIKEFIAYDCGITDLPFLSGMPNLTELHLGKNDIHDISEIGKLTFLETLDLSETPIESVDALSGLSKLSKLNLEFSKVKDITPLEKCRSLKKLFIFGTSLTYEQQEEFLKNSSVKDFAMPEWL